MDKMKHCCRCCTVQWYQLRMCEHLRVDFSQSVSWVIQDFALVPCDVMHARCSSCMSWFVKDHSCSNIYCLYSYVIKAKSIFLLRALLESSLVFGHSVEYKSISSILFSNGHHHSLLYFKLSPWTLTPVLSHLAYRQHLRLSMSAGQLYWEECGQGARNSLGAVFSKSVCTSSEVVSFAWWSQHSSWHMA